MSNTIDKIRNSLKDWLVRDEHNIISKPNTVDYVEGKLDGYLKKHKHYRNIDDFQIVPIHDVSKIDCTIIIGDAHHYFMLDVPVSVTDTTLHPDTYKAYDRAMRGI